jgi:hypothetical protein
MSNEFTYLDGPTSPTRHESFHSAPRPTPQDRAAFGRTANVRRRLLLAHDLKGNSMNRAILLLLTLGLSLAPVHCWAAEPDDQAKAIAEIEKLGGKVVADEVHPGQVWVWFEGNKVTDAGLAHVKDLRQLRTLVLDGSSVTDAGLANLEGLTTLRWLALNKTHITDAGLVHLKGLIQLEDLELAHTPVTDAGLPHLKALTHLRSLGLEGTKVTYSGGVKDLQKALPKCTILFGSPAHVITPIKQSADERLVRLLVAEAVQRDLGLTPDQVTKITDLFKLSQARWREFNAKLKEIFPPGQFSKEEAAARERKLKRLSDDYESEGREIRTKLLGMLSADQSQRLKQIELQTAVAAALGRPEITEALQISAEQLRRIELLNDRFIEGRSPPDLRHLNSKERRQRTIDYMKESDRASAAENKLVLEVLTSEQRAKFEKLQGKKIEVTWPYDELVPEDFTF